MRTFSSRFSGVRSDGLNQWDLSAIKKFVVHEGVNAEFRAEILNAFNQVWMSSPNTTPTSTAFGTITGTGNPRIAYLGLRVKF